MLNDTKSLYQNLENELANIKTDNLGYIESVFAEMVVLKGAEEIKSKTKDLIYKYFIYDRKIAKDIIDIDGHIMPREWQSGKTESVFSEICSNKELFGAAKTIISARHNTAHATTIQIKIPFKDLKNIIDQAEAFLLAFENFIDSNKTHTSVAPQNTNQ